MNIHTRLMNLSILMLLGLSGCGTTEVEKKSSSTPKDTTTPIPVVAGVSLEVVDASLDSYKVVTLTGDKNLKISLGSEEKDVYLLVSNPDGVKHMSSVSHNQKVIEALEFEEKAFNGSSNHSKIVHATSDIQRFNNKLRVFENKNIDNNKNINKISKLNVDDQEGGGKEFYMNPDSTELVVSATARKVIEGVDTAFGKKSLTIWVENSAYGTGCQKAKCVTPEMVDALSDKFLKVGNSNDIYDWVTNLFGEEWGENSSTSLIDESDHISILLTDISQDDSPNGGVIGYFYSKDNFKKEQYIGSNERIMFYIDSVMYANSTEDSWSANNFWAQQIFSTLAHEFQHMIYFYQKNVKQKQQHTEIWINEMLSESTEDLMAVKMNLDGPRNVIASRGDAGDEHNINGRYPLFNRNNKMAITSWDNSLEDYSKVSSFGAYLMRNYGGSQLLHDIVSSSLINKEALVEAVNKNSGEVVKTFDDLVHEWGVAVLLSKRDDISPDSGYLYNSGTFIASEHKGITYNLGSINFFNYSSQPTVERSMGSVDPHTNYYYQVGENLTGDITLNVTDTAGLNISLVVVE